MNQMDTFLSEMYKEASPTEKLAEKLMALPNEVLLKLAAGESEIPGVQLNRDRETTMRLLGGLFPLGTLFMDSKGDQDVGERKKQIWRRGGIGAAIGGGVGLLSGLRNPPTAIASALSGATSGLNIGFLSGALGRRSKILERIREREGIKQSSAMAEKRAQVMHAALSCAKNLPASMAGSVIKTAASQLSEITKEALSPGVAAALAGAGGLGLGALGAGLAYSHSQKKNFTTGVLSTPAGNIAVAGPQQNIESLRGAIASKDPERIRAATRGVAMMHPGYTSGM